ncbi:MAG: hypothetical protein ACI8ZT_002100 [Bacteroidia bacterium]|jgi:hypothetical protein
MVATGLRIQPMASGCGVGGKELDLAAVPGIDGTVGTDSRHAWWLVLAGLIGGNEQYWGCRGKSVNIRMPQGWMVTRIPALIFDGIVEIRCLYFLNFLQPLRRRSDCVVSIRLRCMRNWLGVSL